MSYEYGNNDNSFYNEYENESENKRPLKEKYKPGSNDIPILKPSNITIKYGVELEICVKLDEKCIGKNINTFPIRYTHRDRFVDFNKTTNKDSPREWLHLVAIYLDGYIKDRLDSIKSSEKPEDRSKYLSFIDNIRNVYKFIIITDTPKNTEYKYIYDLYKLELIELEEPGKIDYTKPIITTDASVICGDYSYLYEIWRIPTLGAIKKEYRITKDNDINNTFHIEFVTPILSCTPKVGKEGLEYNLSPLQHLFELIGMDKEGCYVTNKSQGLHVNISLMNNKTKKPLPLLLEFFNTQFFKDYLEWEMVAYHKYRSGVSQYAKPLYGFIKPNNYTNAFSKIKEDKYVSLHRKALNELIEIRLFSSSSNYNTLLLNTQDAINLLFTSYTKWYASIVGQLYSKSLRRKTFRKPAYRSPNVSRGMPARKINVKREKTRRRNERIKANQYIEE
jgi:hypothetical protein